MPTLEISGSDQTTTLPSQSITGGPALLISGSRNRITAFNGTFASSGSGPAIVLSGAANSLVLTLSHVSSSGPVAIQGSESRDEIFNNNSTIVGNVLLGGGNDYYQNNHASAVGQVFGGDGDDYLGNFQGSVALSYFGENGDDFLSGGTAADLLDGGDDNDSIIGGGGTDTLIGGNGADVLEGGLGNDSLSGGGQEGDIAVFGSAGSEYRAFFADFQIAISNGNGTVTDLNTSNGDLGVDTLSGIHILRFTDQQVDTRVLRNEFVVSAPGTTHTNLTDRYGYYAVDLHGAGITFINQANIVGTGVAHNVEIAPGQFAAAAVAALAVNSDNQTIENRMGGSIASLGNAISTTDRLIVNEVGQLTSTPRAFNLTIINDGLIRSIEGAAIRAAGGVTLTNSATGIIEGRTAVSAPNAGTVVNNAGTIRGVAEVVQLQGGTTALQGGIALADVAVLLNTGLITGNAELSYTPGGPYPGGTIRFGFGAQIENRGTVEGGYGSLGGGNVRNFGLSTGNFNIDVYDVGQRSNSSFNSTGYQFASFLNEGTFNGSVQVLGQSQFNFAPPAPVEFTSVITNRSILNGDILSTPTLATLAGGIVPAATFVERVNNSGTINGRVSLGDGNDEIINSGFISGLIDMGAGNDLAQGGNLADMIDGGIGADSLFGGLGNDTLYGDAADLVLDGGVGTDRLILSASGALLAMISRFEQIELRGGAVASITRNQLVSGFEPNTQLIGTGGLTINMATGDQTLSLQNLSQAAGSNVSITANGSSVSDSIKGSIGIVNAINGGAGNDQIRGGTAADTINGGADNDKILGFTGADILTGGTGSDQFRYLFAGDSGLGAGADRITDFTSGSDRLNFALLDTNAGLAGIQGFAFVGNAAFNGGAAQIRYANSGTDLLVQADINGDSVADMEIILQDLNGGTLTAADFIL